MKVSANLCLFLLFPLFLAGQTLDSSSELRNILVGKMVSEPAPDFTLKNRKGEYISLESLRGKIVVLDFWATWCPPCVRSLPAMTSVETQYKNDEKVQFVYLCTRERGTEIESKVERFLSEKGYDFNVLFDKGKDTFIAYGPRGIPAKFIIDQEGNIRFKSLGFNGNSRALIDELTMMIEIIKGE